MEFISHPAFWVVLAAVSELIGMSKLKSNSIIQLVLQALYAIKPGKALIPPDSRWLLRFSTRSPGEELQRLITAEKFRATLPAKLDAAEDAWHATQPKAPDPIIVEHPIDDTLQTGDSRLLGGGMSVQAPWKQ
jgi:hypothetical protein